MFSFAREQLRQDIGVPSGTAFSHIGEEEREMIPNVQSFVAVATALGPKFKKESSRAASLDIQITSYKKTIKALRQSLANESILSSEALVEEKTIVLQKRSLTQEQLDDIRNKHVCSFQNVTSKHSSQPPTPQIEPSLPRDVVRKFRKSQKLNMKKAALKREIVGLAKEFEQTTGNKDSTKVRLSAVPYYVSEAVCSEFHNQNGVDRAKKRRIKEQALWERWQKRKASKAKIGKTVQKRM